MQITERESLSIKLGKNTLALSFCLPLAHFAPPTDYARLTHNFTTYGRRRCGGAAVESALASVPDFSSFSSSPSCPPLYWAFLMMCPDFRDLNVWIKFCLS